MLEIQPKIDKNSSSHHNKRKTFSNFPDLIKLQQSNGLKFVTGRTHGKACAQFIKILADVIRGDIKNILQISKFFSTFFNGSQPKKTLSEKITFVCQSCY